MHRRIRQELNHLRCRYLHAYKYPVLFVSCCPKSASTWFANLLARVIPGYSYIHPESFRDPDGDGTAITTGVLDELRGRYAVTRAHTAATPENLAAMDREFGKYMFAARDLRDVAVSVYYHLQRYPRSSFIDTGAARTLPWKPLPQAVLALPKNECLDAIIGQLLPDLAAFTRQWLDVIERTENCLLLRYEDVTRDTAQAVRRVLRFYELNVSDARVDRLIDKYDRSKLAEGRWKFRKGDIGDWRTELTPAQQRDVASLCGDLVPRLSVAA